MLIRVHFLSHFKRLVLLPMCIYICVYIYIYIYHLPNVTRAAHPSPAYVYVCVQLKKRAPIVVLFFHFQCKIIVEFQTLDYNMLFINYTEYCPGPPPIVRLMTCVGYDYLKYS